MTNFNQGIGSGDFNIGALISESLNIADEPVSSDWLARLSRP